MAKLKFQVKSWFLSPVKAKRPEKMSISLQFNEKFMYSFNPPAPSADMVRNECESVKRKLFLTQDEAVDAEKNTRGQSADSPLHDNRNERITSSKCYRCTVLKVST